MGAITASLNEYLPAEPETVPIARRALTDLAARAGASGELLEEIRLAVSEALTNAVLHAYRDEAGEVHVTAAVVSGELWILISDEGRGLAAQASRPGLGLGLALIAQASDDLMVVPRSSGGTEVRMRFNLGRRVAKPVRPLPGEETDGFDQLRGSLASATAAAASRFSTTT